MTVILKLKMVAKRKRFYKWNPLYRNYVYCHTSLFLFLIHKVFISATIQLIQWYIGIANMPTATN